MNTNPSALVRTFLLVAGAVLVAALVWAGCASGLSESACRYRVARAVSRSVQGQAAMVVAINDDVVAKELVQDLRQAVPEAVCVALLRANGGVLAEWNPKNLKRPAPEDLSEAGEQVAGVRWVVQALKFPGIDPGSQDSEAVLKPDDQGLPREKGAAVEGPKTRPGKDPAAVVDSDPKTGDGPGGAPDGWLLIGLPAEEK